MTAKELREQFNKDIQNLQDNCVHEKSTWMDYMWAPGHFGLPVRVCDYCEKILEHTKSADRQGDDSIGNASGMTP